MNKGATATKPYKVGIENVFIEVLDDNLSPLERADDGLIFCSNWTSKQVRLSVRIGFGTNLFGFSVDGVDGNKNITPLKNYSNKDKFYRKKVPICRGKDTHYTPFTMYHENHISLLELKSRGHFAVHEIAVVFQKRLGFLTTQRVYEGICYRDGLFISCPEFNEKWHQLIDFIGSTSEKFPNLYLFPNIKEYTPGTSKVSIDDLENDVGIVKWFNVAQGFGVLKTNQGDAFFGYKDVSSSSRLVCQYKGEEVLFEKLVRNPDKESSIPFKAIGVVAD